MKKTLIYLSIMVLVCFFTMGSAYCEEDFFLDSNFQEAKNKSKSSVAVEKLQNVKNKAKEHKFFSKKEKKQRKYNYQTNRNEEIPKGYYGTLPDINEDFKYKQQASMPPVRMEAQLPDDEDLYDENLKKAPYDDALFLDVIVKREKSSNYVNDLQKTKFALNNLKKCIEERGDIQRFNACVNMIDLYSKNLETKYEHKSESLKESYMNILTTNYYAKKLGNLMYDANYYGRYVPTQTGQYSTNNINNEQEKLLNRINKTLFLINQES